MNKTDAGNLKRGDDVVTKNGAYTQHCKVIRTIKRGRGILWVDYYWISPKGEKCYGSKRACSVYSPTQKTRATDKSLSEHNYQETIIALEQALFDSKAELEAGGGCDHSVGICACSLIRNIERIEGLLPKLKDAKTAPIVKKEVNEEWVAIIENQRDNICQVGNETTLCHLADPCCSFMRESCNWWQQLKKDTGVEG